MARERRRLAAVVSADVVGYSRLMGRDERGTLAALRRHRAELVDPAIAEHDGRIVKTTGDGLLLEFPSVVAAVECSVTVQTGMLARNVGMAADDAIRFRAGVHLGDVIVDGDDILGEGVNIAARLQEIADPGGIAISGPAYDHLDETIAAGFVDGGERQLKNIRRPVQVWRWAVAVDPPLPSLEIVAGGGKPSVAVLPLTNMSGDPEQEYFADGITEDLITELSRFQSLSVIARNSTFTYKGRSARVQDVGRDLGVGYVVEGSIRKVADRVRITVQLIEASTGTHLWAERYDREITALFELQDELTRAIVATVSGRLQSAIVERLKGKPPTDLNAYDRVMRAKLCHHRGGPDDNQEAQRLLDEAMQIDPGFAPAYGWKVCVLHQAWVRGYQPYSPEAEAAAFELIRKGIAEDQNDIECVRILCEYHMEHRQFDDAERYNHKALRLNPNDPRIVAQRGELLTWEGQPDEAVAWLERANRLDPFGAEGWAHLYGRALFGAGRYEEALGAFKQVPVPRAGHYAFMAACCALLDRADEAAELAAKVTAAAPDFTAGGFVASLLYKLESDQQQLLAALRKAGLSAP